MTNAGNVSLNPAGVDYLILRLDFVMGSKSYTTKDFIPIVRSTVQKAKTEGRLNEAWTMVQVACASFKSAEAVNFLQQTTALLPYANGDYRVIDRLLSYCGRTIGTFSSAETFLKNKVFSDFWIPYNLVWFPLFPSPNWEHGVPKVPIFQIGDQEHIRNFEAFWAGMWKANASWTFLKMMDFGAPEYMSRDDFKRTVTGGYKVIKTLVQIEKFDVLKDDVERDIHWEIKGADEVTFKAGAEGMSKVTLKRSDVMLLKQMQDVVKLTGYPTATAALVIQSLTTKEKIGAMEQAPFVAKVTAFPKAPISTDLATAIYNAINSPPDSDPDPEPEPKPEPQPDPHKRVRKRDLTDPANPAALTSVDPNAGPVSSSPQHPTVNELVGGTDLITVDDGWTTITSPAAYFVDLLELLKQTEATRGEGNSAAKSTRLFDLLVARRPDLPYLQLSIENTKVALPYLDLVNEVMTQVIYAKEPASKNDPVYYDTKFGEDSKDLLAQPRHIDYNAYRYISGTVPIGSLPYDPHLHRIRVLLRAMGTSLLDLMLDFPSKESHLGFEALQTDDRDRLVHTEFLNISDEEINLLISQTPSDSATVRKVWGVSDAIPDSFIKALLSDVKNEVLPRADIEIGDLSKILKTDYINPGAMRYNGNFNENTKMEPGPIVIMDNGASGTPGLLQDMKLLHRDGSTLDWAELQRIQIFIRVWKHLNSQDEWSVDDLDHAFKLFSRPSGQDFDLTLGQIDCISQISKITGLDLQRVMVFFGNMSMSLYREIFVRHDLATKDPVFEWDQTNGLYLGDSALKVSDHLPVVLAALRIPSNDYPLLLEHLGRKEDDSLNFQTLSSYLRATLLCEVFGIRLGELEVLAEVRAVFGPADTPKDLLRTLKKWEKLTSQTFNVGEMIFIATGDDPDKLGIDPKDGVSIAGDLGSQLSLIESQYPDIIKSEADSQLATPEAVTQYASLLFGSQMSKEILDFLEGRRVVRIHLDPSTVIPSNFKDTSKLKISQDDHILIATGLLTDEEMESASTDSKQGGWVSALTSIRQLARDFYHNTVSDAVENEPDAKELEDFFLQGDDSKPGNDTATSANIAQLKRAKFLWRFIPVLRARLVQKSVHTFVSNGVLQGMPQEVIREILRKPPPVASDSAMGPDTIEDQLMEIRSDTYDAEEQFEGYLVPDSTDSYRFIADANPKNLTEVHLSVTINQKTYSFTPQFEGSRFLVTDLIPLSGSKTYKFAATAGIHGLQWRAQQSLEQTTPVATLIRCSTSKDLLKTLDLMLRVRMVVERLQLNSNEVAALDTHLSWQLMDYLMGYIDLRAYIVSQKEKTTVGVVADKLLSVFPLRIDPSNEPRYGVAEISSATGWSPRDIRPYSTFNKADKVSWKSVLQIKSQLATCKRLGVLVDDVYRWTSSRQTNAYEERQKQADELTLLYNNSSRMPHELWEQTAADAVYNELRDSHRKALVSFLIQQDWLRDVDDEDALFEYLLIDSQMGAGLETTRMKQAISTIQLFVQRCLLGLEAEGTLRIKNVDAFIQKWNWMSKYRVWESNRKVFLFPENWIDPTLRDDKSSAFQTFESNLLKGSLTEENATHAIMDYIHEAYEVRSLSIVATYTHRPVRDGSTLGPIEKIHYFGRTVSAPYTFYHRTFTQKASIWTPWRKIETQIAVIENDSNGVPLGRPGSFIVPYQHEGRLLLFLPQFLTKTSNDNAKSGGIDASRDGDKTHVNPPTRSAVTKYWEIKIAWTEFRNNKWSPKILCSSTLEFKGDHLADVRDFRFLVGRADELLSFSDGAVRSHLASLVGEKTVTIYVDHADKHVGMFAWRNGALEATKSSQELTLRLENSGWKTKTKFHQTESSDLRLLETSFLSRSHTVSSMPYKNDQYPLSLPDVTHTATLQMYQYQIRNVLVPRLMSMNDAEGIFGAIGEFGKSLGSSTAERELVEAFGGLSEGPGHQSLPHELRTPVAIYNWEIGFHIPAMIMDRALSAQQFDLALKYGRFIFDPIRSSGEGSYWKWPPFAAYNPPSSSITDQTTIEEWKQNPFQPHVVARGRPLAYKKWVVMKYIEVLVAYGDFYFRQNTLETIPMAIQLFVEASHIFGPKGQYAPEIGRTQTDRYDDLKKFNFDALSNLKVDMEYTFPFAGPKPSLYDDDTVLPLGAASSEYFKYYSNPKMVELRSLIDDRLMKIRNCMDINGVKRKLALFEPPMDPGALVAAMSQAGASLANILRNMDNPMPNCRFRHILPTALLLCHELKKFSFRYVAIKERADVEELAMLRANQYTTIQRITTEIQQMEIEVAQKELEVAKDNLAGPQMRLRFYRDLIGAPNSDSFQEITQNVDRPSESDNLRQNSLERDEHSYRMASTLSKADAQGLNFFAGILEALPNISEKVQPFGVGVETKYDGKNLSKIPKYGAKVMGVVAQIFEAKAKSAARANQMTANRQKRTLEANNAGYEVQNIEKQIELAQTKIRAAEHKVESQKKFVDQALEMEDFLRSKYTGKQLYVWLENAYKSYHYQSYNLAYDIAKRAEKAYQFECGDDSLRFIQYGYWDDGRSGLGCAEGLYLDLKRLEQAHLASKPYDYEIVKNISLRELQPLQLLLLRETGYAEIEIPELAYDLDFPGQYFRRIKTVSVSVDCTVAQNAGVCCTLQLLEHKYRTKSVVKNASQYAQQIPDAFRSDKIPIESVAISQGTQGSGMFELNFKDERFLPFEGAGAISKWSLEFPAEFRHFDYQSIKDIIFHVKYTSKAGGGQLKAAATASAQKVLKDVSDDSLVGIFDLRNDFPDEWAAFATASDHHKMDLSSLKDKLPFFAHTHAPSSTRVSILTTDSEISGPQLSLSSGRGAGEAFGNGQGGAYQNPDLKQFDLDYKRAIDASWRLQLTTNATRNKPLDTVWLVVHYHLG